MAGYIVVVPNSHYAKRLLMSTFTIANVPDGQYT